MNAQETYNELQTTYDAIQSFLNSYQFGPEQDSLIAMQEELGKKIFLYNKAIIEKNSQLLNTSMGALKDINESAQEARDKLNQVSDHIATANKIAGILDKLLQLIDKLV
jgi:hypothetical protein